MIPNGFDCNRFVPNASARARIRRELAIPESELVIGHVARYRQSRHRLFIEAAALVAGSLSNLRARWRGGVDSTNRELNGDRKFAFGSRVKLLGLRTDIPDLTAADIAVVSSHAEFPQRRRRSDCL